VTDLTRLTMAIHDRYVIERELGAGGMATVYLAHDVRHDRKVALKVLRPELSAILGGERFLAEIKTTANLQHPHILSLFDSGEADGLVYYVMPYVDGESLRDRLTREKQLPVEEAVRIAREVADALEYAHQHGVVHRDIKPENILLHGGHAMVADFGIALAAARSDGGTRMTETGMSLGTPHYMAPEQAMGEREITPKADIYALGCVLYEMLTAEPPFVGATAQAIIARVMTEEPRSLALQRKTIPPHIEAAVFTALAKLPADRFASAAQFAEALGRTDFAFSVTRASVVARAPVSASARLRAAAPWVLLAVAVLAGAWGTFRSRPVEPRPVIAFTMELASQVTDLGGSPMALSPDGSRLVYTSQTVDDPQVRLYVRALDQAAATVLATTENTVQPFFSPDGSWIAFWSNGALRKVSVAGGTVVPLTSLSGGFQGGSWGSRGDIVMASNGILFRASPDGGAVDTLLRDSARSYRWPDFLPDGKTVLVATSGGGPPRIQAVSIRSRKVTDLGITGTNPRYVGHGHLVYATAEGGLFAVSFDPARLRVNGTATPIASNVRVGAGGAAKAGHSRNGILAWLGGSAARRELVIVGADGREQATHTPPDLYESPRFSPDGRRIAVGIGDLLGGRPDIWALDLAQGTLSRVTFDSSSVYPEWSPDGAWVHYATSRHGDYDLWRSRSDGSGVQESLVVGPNDQWEGVPSPDGRGLVFRSTNPVTRRDIWWQPSGGGPPVPVLTTPFEERGIAVSPDGRWLAYVSNETGSDEVYVRALPGPGGRVQISSSGGREPRWGPGGRELFYRSRDSVYTVEIAVAGAEVRAGRHRALFRDVYRTGGAGNHAGWDVDRSGRRFVFVRDGGVNSERQINVLVNWFDRARTTSGAGPPRD
jgi:eukaryotic-like serine/threonine-protein kinase